MNPDPIEVVFKKLCLFARLSCWRMPDIFDGRSAEDLPSEVLTNYLESPDGLGWDPAIATLDTFLLGVLKNKMIDHLRRQWRTAGSLDDPDYLARISKNGSNKTLHAPEPQTHSSRMSGGGELSELSKALEDIDDFHNINQQLADKLKTTPSEIVNLKKRLARKYLRKGDL